MRTEDIAPKSKAKPNVINLVFEWGFHQKEGGLKFCVPVNGSKNKCLSAHTLSSGQEELSIDFDQIYDNMEDATGPSNQNVEQASSRDGDKLYLVSRQTGLVEISTPSSKQVTSGKSKAPKFHKQMVRQSCTPKSICVEDLQICVTQTSELLNIELSTKMGNARSKMLFSVSKGKPVDINFIMIKANDGMDEMEVDTAANVAPSAISIVAIFP